MLPGSELSRLDNSEFPPDAGAAFNKPLIPGTAADNLLNSSALSRSLAREKSAPAPPRACGRVMESSLVRRETRELDPAVAGTDVWPGL